MSRKRSAFTLTELLAVMVIMGILMALLIPAVIGARKQTLIKLTGLRLENIEGAIELYKQAFGAPPPPPYEKFNDSTSVWEVPAHYTSSGTKVTYGEDVDADGVQDVLVESAWNIDIDRDGAKDISATVETCLSEDLTASWNTSHRLDGAEALYLFLTAKYRKFLPQSGRFGLQDDGTMILFATVNAGPFLTPDAGEKCDADEDGYPEFADAWGNPIQYNNNTLKAFYYYFFDKYAGEGRAAPKGVDLYSFGPNGVDEGGSSDETSGADDIANWHEK